MITKNLERIRQKVNETALQCGRNPNDIRIVAVSKRFPPSAINEAIKAGQFLFGENYIQEAASKNAVTGDTAQFHFIGHLQTNKAKVACQLFQMIETLDRLKLAHALNKHLTSINQTMRVLVQVNIGRDPNKSGVLPEDAEKLIREALPLPTLHICGLMAIPPFSADPEKSRIHFSCLRSLGEELRKKRLLGISQPLELSMGMSNDFHIAIEEGATLIRVGTAIFGTRPQNAPALDA